MCIGASIQTNYKVGSFQLNVKSLFEETIWRKGMYWQTNRQSQSERIKNIRDSARILHYQYAFIWDHLLNNICSSGSSTGYWCHMFLVVYQKYVLQFFKLVYWQGENGKAMMQKIYTYQWNLFYNSYRTA